MKRLAVAMLMLGLTFVGCGSSTHSTNMNGTWSATLMDTNKTQVFAFTTAIVESGNGSLTISNFNFSSSSPCFVSGESETGTFVLSGDFNGNVSGKFGMNVQSGSPSGNTLILLGSVNGNTVTGTWSLTGGSSCTGSGSFTMTKM